MVCDPQAFPEVSKVAARLRQEYVVRVEGTVRLRKDPNARLATGNVELLAENVSACSSPSEKGLGRQSFTRF